MPRSAIVFLYSLLYFLPYLFTIFRHLPFPDNLTHGLFNYKDTKTKCRLYWCLIESVNWRYGQSCWYFRPSFVNYCNSITPFSLVHLPHPSPFPKSNYIQTVCGWEGVGVVELCWRPYSAGVYHSVSGQLKNCFATPNKNLGAEGASDRLTPTANPFTGPFFR